VSTQTLPIATPATARRWYGFLIPSLADLFFIAIIVWAFALGTYGWQGLLMDGDVGTHIRIGDYIVAHHSVPTRDMFSFSKPAGEWYAFEWLTEVIFSLLHSFAGLKAVVLFSAVVIAAAFTVLLLHALWRGANLVIALALVLMAVNGSSIHFHARPHIFTMLFVAAALWLIAADRRRNTWALWLLVPLAVVWTNLHGGFFVLFAFLGLLVIGCLLESLLWGAMGSRGARDVMRYSLLGAACAAASLVNPYGVKLHLFLLDYLRSDTIRNGVQEFQSPSFRGENMLDFMILLFLGLAISGPLLKKHRLTEVLWIGFMAYNSLVSVRHAPLFMIVAVPILAGEMTEWWNRWVQTRSRRSVARTLDAVTSQFQTAGRRVSIWAAVAVLGLALSESSNWPQNFLEGPFPVRIVEAHADEIASARIYTSDKWAGYLIYRNYPLQRVFFDDRHYFFGEALIQDYLKLGSGGRDWRQVLERYRFDMVLCEAGSPLASLMRLNAGWRTVEDDGKIALFRLENH
jgi:hypothetical protein